MPVIPSVAPSPAQGLWKRFLLLVPLVLVLVLGSYLYVRTKAGTFVARGFYSYDSVDQWADTVQLSSPGVVEIVSLEQNERGQPLIHLRALDDGHTDLALGAGDLSEPPYKLEVHHGNIIANGINFEGWECVHVSLCILLAALVALFVSVLVHLWRRSWYGYTMVANGGGLLFCLFQLAFFTVLLVRKSDPTFRIFLSDVREMPMWFAAASVFLMLPLAVLVSLSNISLILHEGRRPVNMLGIAASIVWLVAIAFWISLSAQQDEVLHRIELLMPLVISFGECLLLSTMACAWLASRHVPKQPMDYLVVLGCGIRKDGTPCPLLAGRVDRAVAFDEAQVAAGAAPSTFVPSGGQGPDEPTSEAQSMSTYLQTQRSVAAERIVLEDRSTTTRENMAYSREVIERHAGRDASELDIGFSTTNYHVFRGYVCAHQAGMAVEGMGSKTKYYFWPNAFLREFVGLLATRWKHILLAFAVISAFYLLANDILSLAIG